MNDTALTTIDQNGSELVSLKRAPDVVLAEAQKAAVALKHVIDSKPKKVLFNGEQYLEFEDWQTLGRFYGVTAKIVDTEFVEYGEVRGFSARAVAVRADGMEISAAEASCLTDEEKWASRAKYSFNGGVRTQVADEPVPLFQLKSMAQTRACSKVLRNVLAWVAVLAGYRPTPAEELDAERHAQQASGGHAPAAQASGGARQQSSQQAQTQGDGLYVTDVTSKTGEGKRGPWTKYTVTFSDGRRAGTFDEEIGRLAGTFKQDGVAVDPEVEQDGKFLNLKGIRRAQGATNASAVSEAAEFDEPGNAPKPKASTNVYTVISVAKLFMRGDVQTYGVTVKELADGLLLTNDPALAKVAFTAKKNDERIEAHFTEKTVKNGDLSSVERWLTDVNVVITRTGEVIDELGAGDMKWSS